MVNAANLLQAQSNYIQQPESDKNMSFGSHFPATYYLQDSREPSTSLPLGCGGNNEDRYQHNVYNFGLSLAGQTLSYIDFRRTNGAFHNWDSSLGGLGDASYVNVDPYNCHQGPEAASRTHSHQEATLPNMKKVNLYGIRSENATVTSITKGKNSTVRTSQAELSDQGNVSKMSSVIKKRNSGAPSAYNAHNSFQNGSLYHPKKIDLSSPLGCGGNNEDRYQHNVYGYGLNMGGQTSSNNDCRRTNGAVHSGDSSLGGFGDASWVKADHCYCLQGPRAASRPYSNQEATLPNMKQVNLYGIRSENATVSSIANGQNYTVRTSQAELSKQGNVSNMGLVLKKQNCSRLQYGNSNTVWASLVGSENQGNVSKISSVPNTQNLSEVQHVNDNAAKISQIESYLNSLIIKAKGGAKLNAHEGKTGHALQCQSTPKSDLMSHVKKSQNHSTPSHQVRQSKFKSQPSQKPSKQPSKQKVLKHHIMWDGMSKGNILLLSMFKNLPKEYS
ncbi:hypothetical protein ACB092_01G379000 [Castanea dentata]